MTSAMMITSVISLLVGLVIPAVTALVTKEHVSDNLKLMLNALLATVSGALSGALTALPHGWHQWEPIAWNILLGWMAAVVTYATHFSPVGSTKWLARKTASFGIGRSAPAGEAGFVDLFGLVAMMVGVALLLTALAIAGLVSWWAVFVWATVTALFAWRVAMVMSRRVHMAKVTQLSPRRR